MGKNFSENVVKKRAGCESDQIHKVSCLIVAQLKQSRSHAVKFSHRRSPLGVHAYDGLANEFAQLLALSLITNKFDVYALGQLEGGTFAYWAELVHWHVVQLLVILDSSHLSLQSLTREIVVSQIVPLPDAGSLLEIAGCILVITIGLGLG